MNGQELTISFFESAVPASAMEDMERLYQNPLASAQHHALYGGISDGTGTYVAKKNGITTAALLYCRDGDKVRVLNEQMSLDAEEINRFARHVFASCEDANVIIFHAVDAQLQRLSYPCRYFPCTEDIVLTLPDGIEAYRARLGKSTRSYMNRYLNKLRRDFPDMRHEVVDAEQISEADVQAIIAMNTARMNGKNRDSYIDTLEAERILHLVRKHGMLSMIRIGGRLCAGAINLRMGRNYFLKVIAHDSAYDEYRIGTLCCFLTICECIARGGDEYHFLWGRYEYKYRLLGKQRDLDHVVIFRSRAQMLRNGGMVLQNAISDFNLRSRSWLLAKAREHPRTGAYLRVAVHALRGLLRRDLRFPRFGAARQAKDGGRA